MAKHLPHGNKHPQTKTVWDATHKALPNKRTFGNATLEQCKFCVCTRANKYVHTYGLSTNCLKRESPNAKVRPPQGVASIYIPVPPASKSAPPFGGRRHLYPGAPGSQYALHSAAPHSRKNIDGWTGSTGAANVKQSPSAKTVRNKT